MATKYSKIQDPNWLTAELDNKTLRQIAEENKCSHSAILYHVRKNNIIIPKRKQHQQHINKSDAIKISLKKRYPDGRYGKLSSNWRGGESVSSGGHIYKQSPKHPNANNNGYVMLHRLVIEQELGRYLTKEEVVHHIDLDKTNNSIENLQLCASNSEHRFIHAQLERTATELIRNGTIKFKDGKYFS
jgi:hypothetical protein